MLRAATLTAVGILSLGLLAGCGDDDSAPEAASCEYTASGQAARDVDLPDDSAPDSGTVEASMQTSAGEIGLTLDRSTAPCTVNSFESLAEQGYFDDTTCHRMTTLDDFKVLQCGDPTGTGSGGPGYSFADELTGDETYPAGTLAMANGGPDTNGSQFFLVYGDTDLPPKYTVFGKVDQTGLDTIAKVAKDGVDNPTGDGAPNTPVEISKVTLD